MRMMKHSQSLYLRQQRFNFSATATATITDDDDPPALSIELISATENAGSRS